MFVQNNFRLNIWTAAGQGVIYYFGPLLVVSAIYGAIYGKFPMIVQGLFIALLYTAVFFIYFKLLFEVYQLKLAKEKTKAKHILLGLFTGIFCYFIGILVLQLIAYISPKLGLQTFEALDLMSQSYQLFVYMILIGPIAEEILIRGFIFTGLKNRYGPTIALFLSSLIFAAIHLPLIAQSIYAFVLGCLLCFLYIKTGSIRACMLAHIVNNGIYFLIGNLFFL